MGEYLAEVFSEPFRLHIHPGFLCVIRATNMEKEEVREADFLARQWASVHVARLVEEARKPGTLIEVRP